MITFIGRLIPSIITAIILTIMTYIQYPYIEVVEKQLEECEAELPRNKHCKIIVVKE